MLPLALTEALSVAVTEALPEREDCALPVDRRLREWLEVNETEGV